MSFRVAQVSGVSVRIHLTSAVTFILLSYAIGIGFIGRIDSSLPTAVALLGGATTAFILFACILLHECGHVACARRLGVEARSVDLYLLGGEARLTSDTESWRGELLIALSGPAASLLLAGVFFLALQAMEPGSTASIITFYLAFANAVMAAANLVPAYPLDGGRVLHAVIWGVLDDRRVSARVAAFMGEALGFLMAGYGAFLLLTEGAIGLWSIALGWYVFNAATRSLEEDYWHARASRPRAVPGSSPG